MDILSYLTELLKTRKEVGIVGLGTICKKKFPGRYDAETQSFLPPGHQLEFTEEQEENSALAEFISKKKNISFDSSRYYVEQFAEELQKQLRETGRADLGELGSFTTDEDGIFFNPPASTNFGFDFYGLPSVKDEIIAPETESTPSDSEQDNSAVIEEPESTGQQELYEEHIAAENEQRNDLDEYTEEETPAFTEEPAEVPEEQLEPEDNNADLNDVYTESDDQPVYDEISEFRHEQSRPQPAFIETPEGQEAETESTYIPPVHQTEVSDNPPARAKTDPYWNFDQAHQLGSVQFYESPDKTEKQERGMPAYLKVIIAGIVLMAIIVVVYFIRPDLFNQSNIKTTATTPAAVQKEVLKTDSVIPADTTRKPAEVIEPAQDTLNQAAVAAPPVQTDTITTWEVIGASVINQKEVDQVLADMKKGGINAKVMPTMPGKRRIKISIATFYDETSAREGRRKLALKLKNPDLYIYQNKHKQTHK